jgi:hypothetical protein
VVNYLLRQSAAPQAVVAEPAAAVVAESLVLFDDTGDGPASVATARLDSRAVFDEPPAPLVRSETPMLTPLGVEALFAESDSDEDLDDFDLDFDPWTLDV